MAFPERDKYSLEQDLEQVEELLRRKQYIRSTMGTNETLDTEISELRTRRTTIINQLKAL